MAHHVFLSAETTVPVADRKIAAGLIHRHAGPSGQTGFIHRQCHFRGQNVIDTEVVHQHGLFRGQPHYDGASVHGSWGFGGQSHAESPLVHRYPFFHGHCHFLI